jgi:hypothetical protein
MADNFATRNRRTTPSTLGNVQRKLDLLPCHMPLGVRY